MRNAWTWFMKTLYNVGCDLAGGFLSQANEHSRRADQYPPTHQRRVTINSSRARVAAT